MGTGELLSVSNVELMVDFEDQTAAYGTAKSSKTGKIIGYDSFDMKRMDALIQNREINGRRTRSRKVPGNKAPAGKLSVKGTIDMLPFWWKVLLGDYSGATNAGSGATGTANLTSTAVTSITVTAGGSGYVIPPRVVFSGGGGSGAEGYAVLTADAVTSVVITAGGTGYTSAPTVAFTPNVLHTNNIGSTIATFLAQVKRPFGTPTYALIKGIRAGSWTLKISSTGFWQLDMDMMGGDVTVSTSNYDASATDLRDSAKIHHALIPAAQVLLNGAASVAFTELTLSGNNNLDPEDYAVGSVGTRYGLTPDDAETKISGVIRFTAQILEDMLNDPSISHSLAFRWVFTDLAYFTTLAIPKIQFDPTNAVPSGRGSFKMPFTGEAHEDSTGKQLTATTSNSRATGFYA